MSDLTTCGEGLLALGIAGYLILPAIRANMARARRPDAYRVLDTERLSVESNGITIGETRHSREAIIAITGWWTCPVTLCDEYVVDVQIDGHSRLARVYSSHPCWHVFFNPLCDEFAITDEQARAMLNGTEEHPVHLYESRVDQTWAC